MISAFQTEFVAPPAMPDVRTVRIRGSVRSDNALELRTTILGYIADVEVPKMVLELGNVEEMDTSGAAVLVEALMAGRDKGMKIFFCSPSESVMQLFRLAGFESVLGQCCPTPADTKRRLME